MSHPYASPTGPTLPSADVKEPDRYDARSLEVQNGMRVNGDDRDYVATNVKRYHGDRARQIPAFATATLRRAVPKLRGKAARRADKLARRQAKNRAGGAR